MADVEKIRGAFEKWPDFQGNREEASEELESWVEAIIEGWKRGYQVSIVDTEAIEAGQELTITAMGIMDQAQRVPVGISESDWRECALVFLENATEKVTSVGVLLWVDYDEASGEGQAMLAFDELDEDLFFV